MPFAPVRQPQVDQSDLLSFHHAHFSSGAIEQFAFDFLQRGDQGAEPLAAPLEAPLEEEDDGLGYYDDAVKRTLTDDQIAMFRHSELEAIRRERDNRRESSRQEGAITQQADGNASDSSRRRSAVTEGEPNADQGTANQKRKKKKSNKGRQPQEPKPDLRKRTWDVVEQGLDTLEYD